MEIFLIKLLQCILALSLLVLLHEGGHFFFARLFGIRVDKFYVFFDPWFHLFEFKPKNSDTRYGIGWIPMGGYCKIAGMIDESMDTKQMAQPAQSWEFRSKPAWQRLLVMLGGVMVNFVLALILYVVIMFTWGETYVQPKNMTLGLKFNKEAKQLGFHDGDVLIGTENGEFKTLDGDTYRTLSTAKRADIYRNGKRMSISLPGNLDLLSMIKSTPRFMDILIPNSVDSIMANSPAQKVGLKQGDTIVKFNNISIASYNDFLDATGRVSDMLTAAKTPSDSLKARTATISFIHKGDTAVLTKQIVLTPDAKVGIFAGNILQTYKQTHVSYSLLESIPVGISHGLKMLKGYVSDLKYIFTSDGVKSLGGFGAIGGMFPSVWDWHMFWNITAFLSIMLAFMNILPFPALDGGHVLFLLYEMITRRKPGEKFLIVAEYVGIAVLFSFMIVENLNDVLRWLGVM